MNAAGSGMANSEFGGWIGLIGGFDFGKECFGALNLPNQTATAN